MLQKGVRGKKRSKEEALKIMAKIHELLPTKDDDEIMKIMGFPNSTYYRYKSKIYKEARKIWKQICKESVEHRALLVKKSSDICFKVNQEIAIDPKQPAKDRIEASALMVEAMEELLLLVKDGPAYFSQEQEQEQETKLKQRYSGPGPSVIESKRCTRPLP